jgi:hypothetical protein
VRIAFKIVLAFCSAGGEAPAAECVLVGGRTIDIPVPTGCCGVDSAALAELKATAIPAGRATGLFRAVCGSRQAAQRSAGDRDAP